MLYIVLFGHTQCVQTARLIIFALHSGNNVIKKCYTKINMFLIQVVLNFL